MSNNSLAWLPTVAALSDRGKVSAQALLDELEYGFRITRRVPSKHQPIHLRPSKETLRASKPRPGDSGLAEDLHRRMAQHRFDTLKQARSDNTIGQHRPVALSRGEPARCGRHRRSCVARERRCRARPRTTCAGWSGASRWTGWQRSLTTRPAVQPACGPAGNQGRQDCPPHPPEPQDLREPQRNEFLVIHGARRRQERRRCRPEAGTTVGALLLRWHGSDPLGGDALI